MIGSAILGFTDWIWGIPMLLFLAGGGVFLTIRCNGVNVVKLPYVLKHTIGKGFGRSNGKKVTGFQALTAALSSTLGTGNIVGVGTAIGYGGPGAVFWMWIVALCVSIVKYGEIVLAVKYREVNAKGEYSGGPMYYLSEGLGIKPLGAVYAVAAIATLILAAAAQVGSCIDTLVLVNINRNLAIVVFIALVILVVYGGFKSIVRVTEKLVPLMALIYILGGIAVMVVNASNLPGALASIFQYAFTPSAAIGGFAGSAVANTIRWGVARGIYSSDSGNGLTSIAHANADVDHPVEQGLWGIFEVLFDTLVVCTFTAMAVLSTGVWTGDSAGISTLTTQAFQQSLGTGLGGAIVSITLFCFVFSTVFVFCYFCEKQGEKLWGLKATIPLRIVFILVITYGAFVGFAALVEYVDFFIAILIFLSTVGLLVMNGQIRQLTLDYFQKEKEKEKIES